MVRKGTGDPALQVEFIKVLTQRVSRASTASISVPVNCDYLTPGWNSSIFHCLLPTPQIKLLIAKLITTPRVLWGTVTEELSTNFEQKVLTIHSAIASAQSPTLQPPNFNQTMAI